MILVTGGAGFIGSNLVAALTGQGREVAVSDRLREGDKWRNLARHELAAFIAPPRLVEFLDAHADALEALVHMGAISATTVTDGDAVMENNFNLSVTLWHWCAEHGVPLIYASSAATYGDGGAGFDDDPDPAALAQLRPLNLYGWSKHLFDRWAVRQVLAARPAPPQWVGLKFFNVYGPNEYHKGAMRSVVAHLYPKIAAGEPATLFESHRPDFAHGEQSRDFVYVRDCTEVVAWLLDNPGVSGLFNLGTGEARSFADLARAAMFALGREPRIVFTPMPATLRDKYQYYTRASMQRLRDAGYRAGFTSLEDGVGDYVRNFLARDDPYR